MNINRKKIGLLIILSGLIIIILLIYFSFSNSKKTAAPVKTTNNTSSSSKLAKPLFSLPPSPNTQKEKKEKKVIPETTKKTPPEVNADDLGKIGMAFADRLGSFSNQSTYSNIRDLELLMTPSMKDWAETYIIKLSEKYKNNGNFYGISTHSLLYKVNSFDKEKGKAKITVITQRLVQGAQQSYRQNLEIDFLKINGQWLVDAAYWQK